MSEEQAGQASGAGERSDPDEPQSDDEPQSGEEPRGGRPKGGRVGDGIRQGIGVLSAFRDALEETIQDARDRGDLSTERAKEVMKEALEKAQEAAEGAKERLDFANRVELGEVRAALDSLGERVGELEESVFGERRAPAAAPSGDTGADAPPDGAAGTTDEETPEADEAQEAASEEAEG